MKKTFNIAAGSGVQGSERKLRNRRRILRLLICAGALVLASIQGCADHDGLGTVTQESASNFTIMCGADGPDGVSALADYGCYCGSPLTRADDIGGAGTPVDAHDRCCKTHDECWAGAGSGCDCSSEGYQWDRDVAGVPGGLQCESGNTACEAYCCKCDIAAVNCFNAAGAVGSAYRDWSPTNTCGSGSGSGSGSGP
ncbi:MAG: hypothetical protein H0T46_13920 [Deltaproteobacteria bacterium]|nr:hypothetical protein [Deltaproteobacteria bacterium]